jgi:type VI protein secretion system component VasF
VARDPDTIEREIEQAREALAATLDELGQRTSPKRLVESGKASMRSRLADPRVRYPLIVVAVLFALLMVRRLFR